MDRKLASQVNQLLEDIRTRDPGERVENGEEVDRVGLDRSAEVRKRKRRAKEKDVSEAKRAKKQPEAKEDRTNSEDVKTAKAGSKALPPEDPLVYYRRVKTEKAALKKAKMESRQRQTEAEQRAEEDQGGEEEEEGKRAITYQIARNKGLTPQRKKEMRNPRVRHRKKFQKAVIKRKSQVPR